MATIRSDASNGERWSGRWPQMHAHAGLFDVTVGVQLQRTAMYIAGQKPFGTGTHAGRLSFVDLFCRAGCKFVGESNDWIFALNSYFILYFIFFFCFCFNLMIC